MEKYYTKDVFTPTKPARIAFVERDSVNDKLVNSLGTPGKQIVIYGHSGTGKTTLLVNKLLQTYETNIVTRCMKGLRFEQLILDAFDQLGQYYVSEKSNIKRSSTSYDVGSTYKLIQAKLSSLDASENGEKQIRMLPPQLTPQTLGRLLGEINACWVLEDFHKIDEEEKTKVSQVMKVFMDLADDYPDLKIIAVGAVDTARQVVDYDREMTNRVAEIHVSLMAPSEIAAIIAKGEAALNIVISQEIKDLAGRHSNGLASVCHHLCLNMCHAANIVHTVEGDPFQLTTVHFESAMKTYVEEASDSIKSAFDKACKQRRKSQYENANLIIESLSVLAESGAARYDIHRHIKRSHPTYPEANLKYLLPKLCTVEYGAIVRFDSTSGLYSFSDPIYRVFALAKFQATSGANLSVTNDGFEKMLLRLLRNELKLNGAENFNISFRSKKQA